MKTARRFTSAQLRMLNESKILGVRAGNEHRFTGVWVVVFKDRVFVRSWNNKPDGWYAAFEDDPNGAIRMNDGEIPVRAHKVKDDRSIDEIQAAYAEKYHTPASRKWIDGFAEPERRKTIIELLRA